MIPLIAGKVVTPKMKGKKENNEIEKIKDLFYST